MPGGGLAPVIVMKINDGKARRWKMLAHVGKPGAVAVLGEGKGKFGDRRIMPDDQQGLDASRDMFEEIFERAKGPVVERGLETADGLLREFLLDDFERLTGPPRRRDKREIGRELCLAQIGADPRRARAAPLGELPFNVGARPRHRLGMPEKKKPQHRLG